MSDKKQDLAAILDAQIAAMPSHEEIRRRIKAPVEEDPRRFAVTSLERWLGVAERAGVPYVPGEVALRMPHATIMRFDRPEASDRPYWRALRELTESVAAAEPPEMLRWDCCASLDVKWAMGEGRKPEAEERSFVNAPPHHASHR